MSEWADEMKGELARIQRAHLEKKKRDKEERQKQKELRLKGKVEVAEARLARAKLKSQRLKRRSAKVTKAERSLEARRLIIQGRFLRKMAKDEPAVAEAFKRRFEGYVTDKDRWLFGLEDGLEQFVREEAERQFGIPPSACVSVDLLVELEEEGPSNTERLQELVDSFEEELGRRRDAGTLTHADLMASKRISQLMDCMAYNEGRVTVEELAQKNAIFANVDMSEATLGESGRASDLWPEDTDE